MTNSLDNIIGSTAYDRNDEKIGKVKELYLNDETGSPTWVAVSTGLLSSDSLVPLAGASHDSDRLRVSVTKDAVKDAPHLDSGGHLTADQERELFKHYGIDASKSGWDQYGRGRQSGAKGDDSGKHAAAAGLAGTAGAAGAAGTVGAARGDQHRSGAADDTRSMSAADDTRARSSADDTRARSAADMKQSAKSDQVADRDRMQDRDRLQSSDHRQGSAMESSARESSDLHSADRRNLRSDDSMILSEEHLRVGTESQETGKARLRKYVVTEEETVKVPVSHEEVRVIHEPIDDPSSVTSSDYSEDSREVILHADKVRVTKESVPVERVRLDVQNVQEEQTVSDSVRRERVEVEGAQDDTGNGQRSQSDVRADKNVSGQKNTDRPLTSH